MWMEKIRCVHASLYMDVFKDSAAYLWRLGKLIEGGNTDLQNYDKRETEFNLSVKHCITFHSTLLVHALKSKTTLLFEWINRKLDLLYHCLPSPTLTCSICLLWCVYESELRVEERSRLLTILWFSFLLWFSWLIFLTVHNYAAADAKMFDLLCDEMSVWLCFIIHLHTHKKWRHGPDAAVECYTMLTVEEYIQPF